MATGNLFDYRSLKVFQEIVISLQNHVYESGHWPFKNMALFYSNSSFPERKVKVYSKTQNMIKTRMNDLVWLLFAPATHPGTLLVVIFVFCRIKIASSELSREILHQTLLGTFTFQIRKIVSNGIRIRIISRLFLLLTSICVRKYHLRKGNTCFIYSNSRFMFEKTSN